MSILDFIIGIAVPHRCLGCRAEGALLCRGCLAQLIRLPPRCYRCRAMSEGSRTCASCRSSSDLYRVTVGCGYENNAKDLIWQLKFHGAQAAAQTMALYLANQYFCENVIVVPVPTSSRRVRQRGYDQACLLARELGRQLRQPYRPYLVRKGQQHQVGASRHERLSQLNQAFRVRGNVKGKHILLVDDVLTTGATLQAAAKTIKAAGASRVEAIVFAQA